MSTLVTEYICEDCGALIVHPNPTTLQSMKEVHLQLCPIKRQKILANAEAEKLKKLSAARAVSTMHTAQPAGTAAPTIAAPNIAAGSQVSTPAAIPGVSVSGDTTIQLTGTGTGHSAAEGPIDMGFKSKRQTIGKFKGIQVWGPYDPPGQLGIWGTDVCVDFDICVSDGACIDACPVNVYEWLETQGHPASERKPFMIREKDCIFCLACENVCPPQAIKIFKK